MLALLLVALSLGLSNFAAAVGIGVAGVDAGTRLRGFALGAFHVSLAVAAITGAAVTELERCATRLGHVGAMIHGRTGARSLDDPCFDDLLATAARLGQPTWSAT
jgi:hypothetical protein